MAITGYKTVVEPSPLVRELKRLLDRWREEDLIVVRSDRVVPDISNRGHTGLSLDHIHFLATSMQTSGFRARPAPGDFSSKGIGKPHDVPVYVRGSPQCVIARRSILEMRAMAEREPDYPRVHIDENDARGWFCSLGNGHFTQALNCFRQHIRSVFTGERYAVPKSDVALSAAVNDGVLAIVLREDTDIEDRRRIAFLLNATHQYKWSLDKFGQVDISPEASYLQQFSNFEAMSKHADSEELTELVRLELGYGMNEKTGDRIKARPDVARSSTMSSTSSVQHNVWPGQPRAKL
eukprot:g2186.t1